MRNLELWRASKYGERRGALHPSLDAGELSPSSRHSASLVADFYTRVIPQHVAGSLLDLGCGKQPLYGAYRQFVTRVVAVDWPASVHASRHVDVHCDINRELPLRDRSFDTVLSSDVLEHLVGPELMFREAARVLRPGGKLILNTPFLYPVHEAPHDYLRHTRFSLERLTRQAGLELVMLEPIGGVTDVLVDIVGKTLHAIPAVGPRLAGALQAITVRLRHGWFFRHTRRASSPFFPLAHGLVARRPTDAGSR